LVGLSAAFLFTQFGVGVTALTTAVLGAVYAIYVWRHASEALKATRPLRATEASTPTQPQTDGQTRLDLIHLLDFSVNETTYWMLDRLLETAASPEVTDGFSHGVNSVEAHKSRQWFIGYAQQEIGVATFRRLDFDNAMQMAAVDAERELKAMPQDQRPSEIDTLDLRQYMISDLQFRRAVLFIQHQRRAMKDSLVNQRHRLIELLQQRNTK